MPSKVREEPPYLRIAENLKKEIEASSDGLMPSIDRLCERFAVSDKTILKAVRVLSSQGLIRTGQGKRMVIVRCGDANSSAQEKTLRRDCELSHCKLYEKIRADISAGVYRVGHVLPKVGAYAAEKHLAQKTVCRALKMLEKQNLIHKEGKKWVVGPHQNRSYLSLSDAVFLKDATVIVLWPFYETWHDWCFNTRDLIFPFFQTLIGEIEKHGITAVHGFIDSAANESSFPKGIEEILDLIVRQKERYAGALVCHYQHALHASWIQQLAHFRKAVVCSNIFNWDHPSREETGPYRVFCAYNQRAAVKLALDILVKRGHHVIGMMRGFASPDHTPVEWIERRIDVLKTVAAEFYPEVKIVVMDQDEEFWHDAKWRTNENLFLPFLQELAGRRRHGATATDSGNIRATDGFRECSPGLWNLVNYPGLTAVIAANDLRARLYSIWFKQVGISVPNDISLIGFDNDIISHYYPISTIDFGATDLAYLAAHVLIGDIPIRTGKDGILEGVPAYINRGSVASPR